MLCTDMKESPSDAICPQPRTAQSPGEGGDDAAPQNASAGVLRIGLKEWEDLSPLRREILRQLFIARKEDD